MNPTRVFARNTATFHELDLELPVGCTALVGANGVGKSSIVNLVDLALFGAHGRSIAEDVGVGAEGTELEIGCEFEHGGVMYRVRRAYSARGRGQSKVDLERCGPGDMVSEVEEGWIPLTLETAKATQQLLEEILGFSRMTFRASAFAGQQDGAAFARAEPRARKQILTEILGLHVYDRLLERAKADRAGLDQELAKIGGRLELAEAELAGKATVVAERDSHAVSKQEADQVVASATQQASAAQAALADAREKTAAAAGARETLAARQRTYEDACARIDRLNAEHEELQETLAEKPTLEQQAGQVEVLERMAEAAALLHQLENARRELAERRERAEREAATAAAEIASIETAEKPECPLCGQEIHAQARESTLAELNARRDGWQAAVDEAARELHDLEPKIADAIESRGNPAVDVAASLRDARQAATRLAGLDEREKRLAQVAQEADSILETFPQLEHELADARAALARVQVDVDLDALVRVAEDEQARVAAARERAATLDRLIVGCDTRLERIAELERASEDDRARKAGLAEELQVVAALERAFGRDGIPALILENAAIPQIEIQANRILSELGTGYTVALHTQRALKSGDGLREALDITVTHQGRERLYETFSGGERTRINLALRIALARLLAHRRGAEVRMLCLDEPDALDETGMDALIRILIGLRDDFDRVLLISHQPALRDGFDQVIEVVKDETGRSQITAARETEPAVA